MPHRSAVLEPRAPKVTTENIDEECLRVTKEWQNIFLFQKEKDADSHLVGIPNPFGRRRSGSYEMFWYPRTEARKIIKSAAKDADAKMIKDTFRRRNMFHHTMHKRVVRRYVCMRR